jgi:peptide/nickel transport system substrate-binding protein
MRDINLEGKQLISEALSGNLTRREIMRRAALLGMTGPLLAGLLAACADRDDADDDTPADTDADDDEEPAVDTDDEADDEDDDEVTTTGGTLIVGTETDIETFDPAHAGALATTRVYRNVYQGLVKYNPGTVELIPDLATEVPTVENGGISEDGRVYTFKLREGVTFHDGTPFNAEAVQFSYRRLYDPDFEYYDETNQAGFFLTGLESVEVVDEYTVSFTLAEANSAFMENANIYAGVIVSPEAIRTYGADQLGDNPAGTGPFRLVEWDRGTRVVLERNPDYWGDPPALDQLIFRPIPEPTGRVSALLAGEVDMIVVVPPDGVDQIEGNPDLIYEDGPGLHYWFLVLNTEEGPFSDVRVRQAANYAVDKEGLANDILRGTVAPATQPLPAAHWAYNPDVTGYPYDPDRARELLTEAGYEDGFEANMIIPVSGSGMIIPVQMNEYIQGNLLEVGIDVSIQSYEWVSYLGTWVQGLSDDVIMNNQSIMASEPYVVNFLLHSGFIPPNGWNTGYYSNPEVDELLDSALRVADRGERTEYYHQAWELIVEDAPWIFVCNDLQPMAFHRKVQGYVPNPAYVIDFTTISIQE